MVAKLLPGLIQATGESLGLHLVSMNEDPHPWINIEHSSIGSEGASLWLPGDSRNWEVLSSQQGKSKANDFLSALQFLNIHFTSWLLLTLWPEWPLITGTSCPVISLAQMPHRNLSWPLQGTQCNFATRTQASDSSIKWESWNRESLVFVLVSLRNHCPAIKELGSLSSINTAKRKPWKWFSIFPWSHLLRE